jgi:hypothetical protein
VSRRGRVQREPRVPPVPTGDDVLSTNREPVVLTVVATSSEADVFPAAAVAGVGRPPGGAALAVPLGLVVGLGLTGTAAAAQAADRWGLPPGVLAIGGLAVAGVAAAVSYRRAEPWAWFVAAATTLAAAVALGSVAGGVVWALVEVGVGLLAVRGDRVRAARWPALRRLLAEHVPVPGTVTGLVKQSRAAVMAVDVWITVTSPAVPGAAWRTHVVTGTEWNAREGDPVTVWYCPGEPAAAAIVVAQDQVHSVQGAIARRETDPGASRTDG